MVEMRLGILEADRVPPRRLPPSSISRPVDWRRTAAALLRNRGGILWRCVERSSILRVLGEGPLWLGTARDAWGTLSQTCCWCLVPKQALCQPTRRVQAFLAIGPLLEMRLKAIRGPYDLGIEPVA